MRNLQKYIFDFDKPLKYIHTKAEGKVEYKSLFFIPSKPPFDLWDRDNKAGSDFM